MIKWIGDVASVKETLLPDVYKEDVKRRVVVAWLDKGKGRKYKITYRLVQGMDVAPQLKYQGKEYYRDSVEFYGYTKRPTNRNFEEIDRLVQEYINKEQRYE